MINHYKLNPNISIERLEELGFKSGGWMPNIESPKMMFMGLLTSDIELYIEINTNTFEFDEYENIFILDNNFGQPYYPFYKENDDSNYVRSARDSYNRIMDSLANNGLFIKTKGRAKKKTF